MSNMAANKDASIIFIGDLILIKVCELDSALCSIAHIVPNRGELRAMLKRRGNLMKKLTITGVTLIGSTMPVSYTHLTLPTILRV